MNESEERYCLFCETLGHYTHECWSTHGLNTPRDREVARIARASIAAKQSAEPDWESRAMFVARLQAKTEREELMTANEVLGLLNDCDHCVSMNRPPSPTAVEAPSLREALAELVRLKDLREQRDSGVPWPRFKDAEYRRRQPLAWQAARAALASPTAGPTQTSQRAPSVALTAKQRYDELRVEEDESDPVERLRAFCSFSMNGQDWCDSEALFTAILACRGLSEARDAPDREALAQYNGFWRKHDDDLRYVARVLEGSHPTEPDKTAALKIIHALRTLVRGHAAPTAEQREARQKAIDALNWYAYEARACAKNSGSARHEAPQALLASVAVLALDGGKRADAAIAALTGDMSTTLRTRKFGKQYRVVVDDGGCALSVAVVNVNGVLRTFWHSYQLASPRTKAIISAAGALRCHG